MTNFTLPHNHSNRHDTAYLHEELGKPEKFAAVSDLFRQMSDPTRIRIFWLLSHLEECVINISAILGMSSPAVSHHLRLMKEFNIIESRRDGKEVYYKIADTEECVLLHKMIEQIMEISCPSQKTDYTASQTEAIKNIHDYLIQHLAQRITIAQLSKQFLMNPTTLKKSFKEVYGTSLAAHINKHRLQKAALLLTETDCSIAEIAKTVGFASQSRFAVIFKQHFKIPPSEYRNTNTAITSTLP